jgi:hypothetical protein
MKDQPDPNHQQNEDEQQNFPVRRLFRFDDGQPLSHNRRLFGASSAPAGGNKDRTI